MEGKDLYLRLHYPAKLSFRMEGQIKVCFPDKVKLKELIITKPLLCEMLKGLISKDKKMIKNTNSKMTANSQLSTLDPKTKTKTKMN